MQAIVSNRHHNLVCAVCRTIRSTSINGPSYGLIPARWSSHLPLVFSQPDFTSLIVCERACLRFGWTQVFTLCTPPTARLGWSDSELRASDSVVTALDRWLCTLCLGASIVVASEAQREGSYCWKWHFRESWCRYPGQLCCRDYRFGGARGKLSCLWMLSDDEIELESAVR